MENFERVMFETIYVLCIVLVIVGSGSMIKHNDMEIRISVKNYVGYPTNPS
jgi:hypothetical protein